MPFDKYILLNLPDPAEELATETGPYWESSGPLPPWMQSPTTLPQVSGRPTELFNAAVRAGWDTEEAYDAYVRPALFAQRALAASGSSPRLGVGTPREFAPSTPEDEAKIAEGLDRYYMLLKSGTDPRMASYQTILPGAADVMRAGQERQAESKQRAVAEANAEREIRAVGAGLKQNEEAAAQTANKYRLGGMDDATVLREMGDLLPLEYQNQLLSNIRRAGKEPTAYQQFQRLGALNKTTSELTGEVDPQAKVENLAKAIGGTTNDVWRIIGEAGREIGGGKQPPAATTQAAKKPLDRTTAAAILKEAGGDKAKARKLARERGYTF